MNSPKNLRYSKTHEWVDLQGDTAKIGLTDFAQSELGDLVFINLPSEGDTVTAGLAFADVESVKAVSDIISPVTGEVAAVNEDLMDAPELMNQKPYEAWIVQVKDISGTEELLSAEEYEAFTQGEA